MKWLIKGIETNKKTFLNTNSIKNVLNEMRTFENKINEDVNVFYFLNGRPRKITESKFYKTRDLYENNADFHIWKWGS